MEQSGGAPLGMASSSTSSVAGNAAFAPVAGVASPDSPESTNPHSFEDADVRKALLNVERINKEAAGTYTRLFAHLKKDRTAMELFARLINTLGGSSAAAGQRMTKPLNQ